MVIMLNRSRDADVIIPWREQNPRERFRQGDPIRAVLKKVDETPKGPRLILSRGDPLFVAALFNLEVPEIYQGIVEIQEIAREVGGRTKIAVSSRDESIDPVGACVGMKGSRVQAVVSELGGERIDIVPWHPDSRDLCAPRAGPGPRVQGAVRSGDAGHHGDRRRGSAVPRDRPQRPERAIGFAAHWMADRPVRLSGVAREGCGRRAVRYAERTTTTRWPTSRSTSWTSTKARWLR